MKNAKTMFHWTLLPLLLLLGCAETSSSDPTDTDQDNTNDPLSDAGADSDTDADADADTDSDSDSDSDSGSDSDTGSGDTDDDTSTNPPDENPYLVGTGMNDITGPPAEVMFAGYCDFSQTGKGIYMRTRARAFIAADDNERIVLVSAEVPLISTGVYFGVIKKLKEEFGSLYTEKNVVVSATHTHSAPGGFFRTYLLNIFAGLGFSKTNYDAIIEGVFQAIVKANNNLSPGRIVLNSEQTSYEVGQRLNYSRSPQAYQLNNDIEEYKLPNGEYDNTQRTVTQLRFVKDDNTEIGAYHWIPVHPNMSGSHRFLINGDVNGLASYRLEKEHGTDYFEDNTFVAAFAYNAASDTSSNLPEDVDVFSALYPDENIKLDNRGAWIADGRHDYERMAMRADTVMEIVDNLYTEGGTPLEGGIDSRQMFVPFTNFEIRPEFIGVEDIYYEDLLGETKDNRRLCQGAAGVSFLAGSMEDGNSGMVNRESNPRTDMTDYSTVDFSTLSSGALPVITGLLLEVLMNSEKSHEEMDCQLEKSIAISLDEVNTLFPNGKPWNLKQPVQIFRIGQLAIITLPVEVSTMSGRRLRKALKNVMPDIDHVVVTSQSNGTGQYLTTRQEYSSQQYEGGSTLLGPYELNAATQMVHDLAMSFDPDVDIPDYAVTMEEVEEGLETSSTLKTGRVIYDGKPADSSFGDIFDGADAEPEYTISADPLSPTIVSVSFVGGHPNNSVLKLDSFLEVQRIDNTDDAVKVAYDWDPETRFYWKRIGIDQSKITVEWYVPADAVPGQYQIVHRGHWKEQSLLSPGNGKTNLYEGKSRIFVLEQ